MSLNVTLSVKDISVAFVILSPTLQSSQGVSFVIVP